MKTHDLSRVWQQLQGLMYLGNAEFVEAIGKKIGTRLSADAQIPRLQRRASAPPLARFAAMPARNPVIANVSRALKKSVEKSAEKVRMQDLTLRLSVGAIEHVR